MEIYNDTYCVYVHINKFNGKKYVGQTVNGNNINKRWVNGLGYRSCTVFYKAIKKYGWNNFEHDIVASNLTLEEANQKEQELIEQYKSYEDKFGYNITKGGRNFTHSEETKKKIGISNSIALKGNKWSESQKKLMSEMFTGEGNPFYGKHFSEESKKKIRENNPSKQVLQFSKDGEFIAEYPSTREAGRRIGCNPSNICSCCKGKLKSTSGFIWKYKEAI